MRRHVSVETPLPSRQVEFRYRAGIAENLQVAVHRAQAYPGQPPSHLAVESIGRRMRLRFAEFFQDDLPLSRHADYRLLSLISHSFHNNNCS